MYLNSLLVKFDKNLIYGPDIVSKTNFGPVWGSYTLETEISICLKLSQVPTKLILA